MGFGGGLTAGADFGTELFRSKDEKEGLGADAWLPNRRTA